MNISRISKMIITQAAIKYTRFIPNWAYSIFRLQVVVVVVLYLIIISLIAAMLNSISDWENFQLVSKLNNWIINNSRVMQYDSYWIFFIFETDLRIALNFCDILFHVACLNTTIFLESHASIWKINGEQIKFDKLTRWASPPKLFVQQCERLNNWLQTCLTFFAETRHCFGLSLHREHWKHNKRLKISYRTSLTYEQAFWIFLLFGHWVWTAWNTNMRKIYLIFNRCFLWNDAYYSGP